jgi:preprotein translocase subunit SecD
MKMIQAIAPTAIGLLLGVATCNAEEIINFRVVRAEAGLMAGSTWRPLVSVFLDDIGRTRFANWTSLHVGETVQCLIDGRVISKARLLSPITGGIFQCAPEGISKEDAAKLAATIETEGVSFAVGLGN